MNANLLRVGALVAAFGAALTMTTASVAATRPSIRPNYIVPAGSDVIDTVSCAPSGYCLLGGEDDSHHGFVAQVNDGTVGKFLTIPGMKTVEAIDCPQNLWCLAYGVGSVSKGNVPDRFSIIANGKVGAYKTFATNLRIRLVGCESASSCFLVGKTAGSGSTTGLIVPVLGGTADLSGQKTFSNLLLSGIACPESLLTCVVVGASRPASSTSAVQSSVIRITGNAISTASHTTGIEEVGGVWCSAYYTCVAAGTDPPKGTGQTEILSHTTGSSVENASVQYLFNMTCATSSLCVAVAQSAKGLWGFETVTSAKPDGFTYVLAAGTSNNLYAVACQGAQHCYEVGTKAVNAKDTQGVLDRFSL